MFDINQKDNFKVINQMRAGIMVYPKRYDIFVRQFEDQYDPLATLTVYESMTL